MSRSRTIPWQSKLILLVILPVLAAHLVLDLGAGFARQPERAWAAVAIAAILGFLVFLARAATAAGAATGGLVAATLYLWIPGWRTALWPLAALLLLTLFATRFGRRAKEALGLAEDHRGRTASQVAANIGVAALCGVPLTLGGIFSSAPVSRMWVVAMVAALSEATADTLSSELGQVWGGEPRLLTTLRRVPRGSDGAITAVGTLCGLAGAAVVVGLAMLSLSLSYGEAGLAWGGAMLGVFLDSFLGEWMERRGWLGNDSVNTLSTLGAALASAAAMHWLR